jgi:uncharacterized protein YcgI (DUF1989 family)
MPPQWFFLSIYQLFVSNLRVLDFYGQECADFQEWDFSRKVKARLEVCDSTFQAVYSVQRSTFSSIAYLISILL